MITKVSVSAAVVAELRKKIESGAYPVGTKLPTEKALCDEFGVGRSSVREAFRILQAKGYVELRPGTGAFVAASAPDGSESAVDWLSHHQLEITDFMEVRVALEPLAVKLAASRATEVELLKLKDLYQQFEQALEQGDTEPLSTLDEQFHTQIILCTHNKLMISINKSICDAFKEYRNRAFADIKDARHALKPHAQILQAILHRDVEAGQKAMLNHLAVSLEDINKNK